MAVISKVINGRRFHRCYRDDCLHYCRWWAFKQVLVDSGVGKYISQLMTGNPLAAADVLDRCRRAAYRAGLCHRGGHRPLVIAANNQCAADPALMVLATGAGSVKASHVNDPGFWLFKGYFNLSVGEVLLRTWTVMRR
jgi:Gnt-II system L-idonate transporter